MIKPALLVLSEICSIRPVFTSSSYTSGFWCTCAHNRASTLMF